MNTKELIEAARNYTNWSLPHGHPEKGFCAWLLSDTETARRHRDDACEAMALHILATVRPDDDEPVTRERLEADGWVKSEYFTKWYIVPREHLTIEIAEDGGDWFFKLGVDDVCIAKMRGIRRLVAALGE